MSYSPAFRRPVIATMPHLAIGILLGVALRREVIMGTTQDHRRAAEECVAMARLAASANDKALWLTLAQSWVRLAEHVARAEAGGTRLSVHPENQLKTRSSDRVRE
jgi:hypothetical protein